MDTILGPVDLKNLQAAFDKLGWTPPESEEIATLLRGDARFRGKALNLKSSLRQQWVESIWRAQSLDRREQAAIFNTLRADIGEWLDHFARGGERPKD